MSNICTCFSSPSSEDTEDFLVLPEQDAAALEKIKENKEQLQSGEPVRAKLDRQALAFRPSQHATRFDLPPDFYNMTAEELKREQQLKYGKKLERLWIFIISEWSVIL